MSCVFNTEATGDKGENDIDSYEDDCDLSEVDGDLSEGDGNFFGGNMGDVSEKYVSGYGVGDLSEGDSVFGCGVEGVS